MNGHFNGPFRSRYADGASDTAKANEGAIKDDRPQIPKRSGA